MATAPVQDFDGDRGRCLAMSYEAASRQPQPLITGWLRHPNRTSS